MREAHVLNCLEFGMACYCDVSSSVVEQSQTESYIAWDWQSSFKKVLGDMAKGVEMHIRCMTGQAQRMFQADLQKTEKMQTSPVPSDLVGGRLDYPRIVHAVSI